MRSRSASRHEGEPELVIDLESGDSLTQPMMMSEGAWLYRLEPARESFRYRARVDRAESDTYKARVWPFPRVISSERTLSYPAYTALAPAKARLERRIEALAGTTVELEVSLNTAVESAWWMMPDGRKVDCRVEVSASETRLSADWKLDPADNGEVVLWVHHRLDRDIELMRFEQMATGDQPPQVVLLSPARPKLKVRPDETLDLRYEVSEDFGVARVAIEIDAGGNRQFHLERMLPTRLRSDSEIQRYKGEAEFGSWRGAGSLQEPPQFQIPHSGRRWPP